MRRETVSACPPRLHEGAPGSLTLGNTVQGNAAEMPHMLQSLHEGGGATYRILFSQWQCGVTSGKPCATDDTQGDLLAKPARGRVSTKKDSRTAAHNLTARKDEQGRSLRNGAPTPILAARKDGHLFANFAGLPGRPCAGPKRQYTAQQHVYQGVILCNGVAPCGESPPVCRPITAREGVKIRTSYFAAAPERKPGNRP